MLLQVNDLHVLGSCRLLRVDVVQVLREVVCIDYWHVVHVFLLLDGSLTFSILFIHLLLIWLRYFKNEISQRTAHSYLIILVHKLLLDGLLVELHLLSAHCLASIDERGLDVANASILARAA